MIESNISKTLKYIWKNTSNICLLFNFTGCGGEVYNVNGVVTSPLYPMEYTQVSDCRWNLKVPEGHLIALKFQSKLIWIKS